MEERAMDDKRIVEINGVKVEVDMRTARVVEAYKVGDNVKVLQKEYGDNYKVLPGVIVGFDQFEKLPTMVIATFEVKWGIESPEIKFHYLNAQSKDIELAPAIVDELPMSRQDALDAFDRSIEAKLREVEALKEKKAYFDRRFGQIHAKQSMEDA